MAPVITHEETGLQFALGRRQSTLDDHRKAIPFSMMRKASAPISLPARTTNAAKAQQVLHQILCNDRLGCCGPAGALHIEGVWRANAFNPNIRFSDAQLLDLYEVVGGYVPGKPETDGGVSLVALLNHWRDVGVYQSGLSSTRIAGYVSIDASDVQACKEAIFLFSNMMGGLNLPDAWLAQDALPVNGPFLQDLAGAANPNNGHCEVFLDYDDSHSGPLTCTWGRLGYMSWGALAKYAGWGDGGELHVAISEDQLVAGTKAAPNAMKWEQLVGAFASLGGRIDKLSHMIA